MKTVLSIALVALVFTACTTNAKTSDKAADRCVLLVHSAEYPVLQAQMRQHRLIMEQQAIMLPYDELVTR